MNEDLKTLNASLEALSDVVDRLELELVDDPNWDEPSDTSYLREKDRANPDIMSNVEAMAATNKLISWFGRDMEGFVGLWRGPKESPIERAPIVRLDTEGQYAIVATTVGDYLAIFFDEDEFDDMRATIVEAGLAVRESREAIWASCKGLDEPNEYRHALYNEERKKRGLEPIK